MTNAMNCDVFNDRLPAYLEHEADDATRAAMERHAAACGDCGPLLADIRKIRADAAHLPELAPSRDLWAGVAARIETPVVPIARETPQPRAWGGRTVLRAVLFAASLVAAAGVGYLSAGNRQAGEPLAGARNGDSVTVRFATVDSLVADSAARVVPQPATRVARTTPAPAPAASMIPAQLAVATLTADYDREIARLRRLIEERRNQLDAVTVATIERNIQVIDAAILDSKKAIAADPSSAFLIESLNQSLQTKVELMRTVAALPIRM